ncbi:FCS-Like Zinc finger 2-like [Juglans microcarpa x Juglans regia]|uniref:FCS-Like Zinc finger 2-like n=1 Tax=Juglans microcarpa x Juglans regia TaxID=2249226 RepID=UPI001B7F76D2|nr:FCS-Like Zinc finger 2-like [Juglans microcarpa x Juglans regia]
MDSAISTRRPCFVEGDDGLASLADMEAGFSGTQHHRQPFLSRLCYSAPSNGNTRSSFRSASVLSPRSGRFYDARFEEHRPHFLEACFLCKKPLGNNKDIFMYRGDTPFCSEDCRQEQIELDEANENNQNLSSSMKALRKKQQRESTSPNETQDYPFRSSTIAAA